MIVVGEALVDLVPEQDGRLDPRPGGAARNLAVAAARLGAPVSLAAGLSRDQFGRRIVAELEDEGIDLSCAPVVEAPTPLAVVTLDGDGVADYAFHLAGTAALELHDDHLACLPGDEPLHVSLGAITLATPGVGDAIVAMLASHDALRSLDPNIRAAFITDREADARRLDSVTSLVDLLRCSEEDLQLLHPAAAPEEVARRWRDEGVPAVVLTRGDGGVVAFCSAGRIETAAVTVEVADTVGAGDSFGAALLVALGEAGVRDRASLTTLDAAGWQDALSTAVRAAAITVSRRGADPPHRHEL